MDENKRMTDSKQRKMSQDKLKPVTVHLGAAGMLGHWELGPGGQACPGSEELLGGFMVLDVLDGYIYIYII